MKSDIKKIQKQEKRKMTKIGIIGTGMLGNTVGLHLLKLGFDLTVYNRTKEKTNELKNNGAKVVDSPKRVAEDSELIIIVVKDADVVKEVSFGKNGIIEGKHEGLTVADMSTINPVESKNISKKFLDHEIIKLDIPVMGGPNVAITGELVLMASGNKNTFDRFRNVFEKKAYKMIQDEFDATFTLANLKKDISTITDTAKSFGIKLPMIEKAEEIYKEAVKKGFGNIDYTGILAYIKKNNS